MYIKSRLFTIERYVLNFSMGDSKRMVKRKIALWERQKGLCFWCQRQTLLSIGWKRGKQSAETATIDHLRTRHDLNRHEMPAYQDEERTVLACYECNHTHGALSDLELPIAERRRRSKREKRRIVKNQKKGIVKNSFYERTKS